MCELGMSPNEFVFFILVAYQVLDSLDNTLHPRSCKYVVTTSNRSSRCYVYLCYLQKNGSTQITILLALLKYLSLKLTILIWTLNNGQQMPS